MILSGLKTLLETGEDADDARLAALLAGRLALAAARLSSVRNGLKVSGATVRSRIWQRGQFSIATACMAL